MIYPENSRCSLTVFCSFIRSTDYDNSLNDGDGDTNDDDDDEDPNGGALLQWLEHSNVCFGSNFEPNYFTNYSTHTHHHHRHHHFHHFHHIHHHQYHHHHQCQHHDDGYYDPTISIFRSQWYKVKGGHYWGSGQHHIINFTYVYYICFHNIIIIQCMDQWVSQGPKLQPLSRFLQQLHLFGSDPQGQ